MADSLFQSLLDTISSVRSPLSFLREAAVSVHQSTAESVGSLSR